MKTRWLAIAGAFVAGCSSGGTSGEDAGHKGGSNTPDSGMSQGKDGASDGTVGVDSGPGTGKDAGSDTGSGEGGDARLDTGSGDASDSGRRQDAPADVSTAGDSGAGCNILVNGNTLYFASGTVDADNACLSCQPSVSASAWSNVESGSSCGPFGGGGTCQAGACTVGCDVNGAFYMQGAPNPATPVTTTSVCESCQPAVSTSSWTNSADGTACDADGGTDSFCRAGTCTTGCFIAGAVYASNAPNPVAPATAITSCETCQPTMSATAWSHAANGTSCSVGTGNFCNNGTCALGCNIDGTYYASGAANPGNPTTKETVCESCQPATSATAWTNLANGASCSAGGGNVCTAGTCTLGCVIGGTFYASGAANPTSACQSCQPTTSATAWSNNVYAAGTSPTGIASDGVNLWATNSTNGTVTKILASTGATVGTYPTGTTPDAVAFDGHNMWIANEGSANVTELLATTGANVGSSPFASQTDPYAITFDGTNMWVANYGLNTVRKFLASTGAVVGTYTVGTNPRGLAFDGANIWVTNYTSNNVMKLTAATGAVVGTYAVGTNPIGIAYDGANMWVANYGSANVTELLASTGATVGLYTVGTHPLGVAFDTKNIWVTNFGSNSVTEIVASTGVPVGTFPVGHDPYGIVYDGKYVWVANSADGTVNMLCP